MMMVVLTIMMLVEVIIVIVLMMMMMMLGKNKSFGFLSIITISEDGDDDGVDCNDDDVGEEKSFGFLSRQLHNR